MAEKEASRPLTIRLDAAHYAQLEERARQAGNSVGLEARAIVQAELEDVFESAILGKLAELQHQVVGLRGDLARTLEVVLVNLAGADPDDVRRGISEHLGK